MYFQPHCCCWYTTATVHEKIADFLRSRKGQDVILVVTVVLLGVVSFGLGRMSGDHASLQPITVYIPVEQVSDSALQTGSAVQGGEGGYEMQKNYVASKSGAVYHLPSCPGAQRIKDENKVWFTTQEDARAAGLRPAANCKGLE